MEAHKSAARTKLGTSSTVHAVVLLERLRSQRGATAIIVALLAPVLVAFLALTVDVAALYLERADAQTAADAGALAVAQDKCSTTGQSWAQSLTDENVSLGTGTASVACTASDVTVTVDVVGPAYFSGIFGATELRASAVATASWTVSAPVVTSYTEGRCRVIVPVQQGTVVNLDGRSCDETVSGSDDFTCATIGSGPCTYWRSDGRTCVSPTCATRVSSFTLSRAGGYALEPTYCTVLNCTDGWKTTGDTRGLDVLLDRSGVCLSTCKSGVNFSETLTDGQPWSFRWTSLNGGNASVYIAWNRPATTTPGSTSVRLSQ